MEMLSREYGWLPSEIRKEKVDDITSYLEIISLRNEINNNKYGR